MALILFDTNILIDGTKNYPEALTELAYWDKPAISITWMEFYGGASPEDVPRLDAFIAEFGFEIIEIDAEIRQASAALIAARRKNGRKIALSDAIIVAIAQVRGLTIITRNTKDFKSFNIRVPYELLTTTVVTVVNVHPPPPSLPVLDKG
jgi:predicted nucleic acid-binding protein